MSGKVLMLHGLAQSGDYFASKTKGFRQEMERMGYELYYPTAPNRFPGADLPDDMIADISGTKTDDGVIAWLQNDSINRTYFLPETTVQYLHDYVVTNGPFDGVVGFSQGAGVAGYLMTDFNGLLNLKDEEQPPIKFFISCSGFRFRPEVYQRQYDEHPIKVPSLHIQGQLDTVSEPEKVQALMASCQEGTKTHIMHAGGHFVPNSKSFLKKLAAWLESIGAVEP
ncbi:putative serine hydrolase KNAG_0J02100 [Huiozyma naganishii CBS 8797]|uniref:Serine hydrolase domain-containing protein n=1 Tax=Huiozyma naganishii (strain ATCC MYA-139 / BCRC 22969 / CBS 8797 / KCTC 17520 / NBRC 10181 / NCYC 3082 / Yp74L-3) TaxID=1071383 RepID=J7SAM0_HUIN7|nr:hypothetical protein KNAG_0J02100 [Kazachstania naganishii CBS 8797]CCK72291.1 hypothetical protein KNAG_0J02100 [Kazachstania naganishii CBS 8797]